MPDVKMKIALRRVGAAGTFLSGALLLLASYLKLSTLTHAGSDLLGITGDVSLILFESVLGGFLVSRISFTLVRWIAAGTFVVFATVSLWQGGHGAESCGCFGKLAISPWLTLAVDIVVLTLLAISIQYYKPSRITPVSAYRVVTLSFLILLPFGLGLLTRVLGVAPRAGDDAPLVIDESIWRGRRFSVLDSVESDVDLTVGEWTLVFFRWDCERCVVAIPKYVQESTPANASS